MAKYKIIPSSRTIVQSPISIGHKAEKGVEAIEFDLTAWVETYGSGTLTVIMRRWGDAIPYPIALEIDENNKATWVLSDTDTARAGMAYAQLSYIVGDEVVKKSDIYTFRVMDSLTGEGEPPEAYESWLEHLTHLAAEAMAEVLDIEGIVTDKTLTVDGGIADAKATGEALAKKVDAADYSELSDRVGRNTIALAEKADRSTTYTKAQVNQMIEDVEVETDTTLEVAGAAADAAETGRQIGLLKADLDDITTPGVNLFDKDNIQSLNAYIMGNNGETGTLTSAANAKTVYIECEPNTTYTLSKASATARFAVGWSTVEPVIGGSVYDLNVQGTSITITVTTGATAAYLVAFIYASSADTDTTFEQICAGFQIQRGSTATEYEPYALTAKDNVARTQIQAIEGMDALGGKFSQVQITASPQAALIGSALQFDITTMTSSGNATLTDDKWVFDLGGSISGSIDGIVANKTYLVELTVSVSSGIDGDININPATVTLGDVSLTFFSAADANWVIALTPTTGGTVTLSCTFDSNWRGTVSAITVKPVNSLASIPLLINSIAFMSNYANIAVGGGHKNLLIGNGGKLNTAIGINAQKELTTGMWNSAFGYATQVNVSNGKGNNAFGYSAQYQITTGCYNNAFGESSQNHMTNGQWNDGFGIETQGMATSAKNNVAMGRRSQHLLQTGNFNTAIGAWSGFNSHDISPEGKNAVKTSSYTTLIGGASTLNGADAGDSDYATALGYQTKVGKHGVALGALSEADEGGIAIGYSAVAGVDEVVIGNKKIIFNDDHTVTWVEVN